MTSLLDFSFISHPDRGANPSSQTRGQAHGDGSTASSGADLKEKFQALMDRQSAQTEAFDPQTIQESRVDIRNYPTETHDAEGEVPSVTSLIPDLKIEIEDIAKINPATEFKTAMPSFQPETPTESILVTAPDDLTQTPSVEGVAPEKPVQPILEVAPEGLIPENLPNEVPIETAAKDDLLALGSFNSGKPVDPILVTSPADFTPDTPVERIPKTSAEPIDKAIVPQMRDVKTDTAAPANLTPSSALTPEEPVTPILVVAPEGLLNPTSPNETPLNALTIENLKFVSGSSPVVGAANPSRDMLEADLILNSPGKIPTQGELLTNLLKVEPVLTPSVRFDVANFQGLNENPAPTTTSSTVQLTPALGPTVSTLPPVQYFAPVTTTPAQIIAAQPAQIGQIIVEATLQQERTIIRIDPPELGRIQLDFDHSTSGRTTILLSAETEAARQILAEKRAFMMTLFESYGLDDVEIKLQRPETTAFSKQEGALNFSDRQEPSRQEFEAKQMNPSADLGQGHQEASEHKFSENNTYRREIGAERLHIRV